MNVSTAFTLLSTARKKRLGRKHNPLSQVARDHLFFREGWGDEAILERCSRSDLLTGDPISIAIEWKKKTSIHGNYYDGSFTSPFLQSALPEECREAHVRLYVPEGKKTHDTPICISFPMTGDEGYSIRTRTFAKPLLKKGIAVMMLENPYYGKRRPKEQKNYFLTRVQDMLVMCGAAVEEGKSLVAWARKEGYPHVGVAGVSQGGMIAATIGALARHPLAVAVSLAAHSPDVILTEGLLKSFVDWNALEGTEEGAPERLRRLFAIGNLSKLPKPFHPKAAIIQGAKRDLVVPAHSVKRIHELWPGSELKWLQGTHVTSIALHEKAFRTIVLKSFSALKK